MKSYSLLTRLAGLGLAGGAACAIYSAYTARRVEAVVPACGRFVDTEGSRLHVVERGVGPPVVLVHGLGGQLQHFTYALFDRLGSDFRLIAIDRPGSGYSTRRDDDAARLAEQARAIHAFIADQHIEKPLIVGHSLGGAVALKLALDYPDSVAGLALLAPLVCQQEVPPDFQMLTIKSSRLRRLVAWTVATPSGVLAGRRTLHRIFTPEQPPEAFETRGGGLLRLRPETFYATSLDLVSVNQDMPAMQRRYHELSMPVGVLFGTGDSVVDPESSIRMLASQLPTLDVERAEGAGHMLPISQPEVTAAFIRRMAAKSVSRP